MDESDLGDDLDELDPAVEDEADDEADAEDTSPSTAGACHSPSLPSMCVRGATQTPKVALLCQALPRLPRHALSPDNSPRPPSVLYARADADGAGPAVDTSVLPPVWECPFGKVFPAAIRYARPHIRLTTFCSLSSSRAPTPLADLLDAHSHRNAAAATCLVNLTLCESLPPYRAAGVCGACAQVEFLWRLVQGGAVPTRSSTEAPVAVHKDNGQHSQAHAEARRCQAHHAFGMDRAMGQPHEGRSV
jgi:hypothetical protein